MKFEEILPRLKAGHTCFRQSERSLGLGSVKTDVSIRRVPETYGGEDAGAIGFLSISRQFTGTSPGVGQSFRETFSIWTPTVDDILATDWCDLDEILAEAPAREAKRAADQTKETAPE